MRHLRALRRLRVAHDDERGTALTEFTLFLPIWIVVFIGILNLGKIGIDSTVVQAQAQKELWDQAIAVTDGFEGEHMLPAGAAGAGAAKYGELFLDGDNPQQEIDGAEGLTMTASLGVYGHYGESYQRTVLLESFMQDGIEPKEKPSEVLGYDPPRYAHTLLNDTLGERSFSGDWTDILAEAVAASGLIPSLAAGIRYGSVFAEKSKTTSLLGGAADVTSASHWDVLVAPSPITGDGGTEITFGVAFLAAKLDENYKNYQQFGKTNWGGQDGTEDTPTADEDEIWDNIDDKVDEDCEPILDSWDPDDADEDPPVPKPDGWDNCNNR